FDRRVFRPAVDGNPRKGIDPIPPRTDLPRAATQPQDLAHRGQDPRDRPSPTARPPSVQPSRRGLQPHRPRNPDRPTPGARATLALRPPTPPPSRHPTAPQADQPSTPHGPRAPHPTPNPPQRRSGPAHHPTPRHRHAKAGGETPPESSTWVHPNDHRRQRL